MRPIAFITGGAAHFGGGSARLGLTDGAVRVSTWRERLDLLAKSTGLHPGDKVSFEFDAGRLIISPISRRKYSLQELLAMQGDEPLVIDKAWDNMPAVGQEVPL